MILLLPHALHPLGLNNVLPQHGQNYLHLRLCVQRFPVHCSLPTAQLLPWFSFLQENKISVNGHIKQIRIINVDGRISDKCQDGELQDALVGLEITILQPDTVSVLG